MAGLNIYIKEILKKSGFLFLKLLASAQVVIAIVRIVPIDVHLAIVRIPVHVRHIAIIIARARYFV
ncbi:MAG: hypothetical protein ABIJ28_02125 [Patescibacteria group bacterium]